MEVGDPLISLKEKGSTVELVGKEKLDGDEVYHLKATSKTGAISNYYISTANYYMLKSLSKTKVQNQEIDSEVTYSNFKQVDGLTFAYTKEQPSPQGGTMTVETESIKLNQTIDESIFKKPAKK
jgi:outer membrane lipoprotein-sorting protein